MRHWASKSTSYLCEFSRVNRAVKGRILRCSHKIFASLQIFFMPVKQMSWPILVRCQIKQELIRSKKSNVLEKGHFVQFIYTFRIVSSRSSKEVYISWPHETHSLALVSFALFSGRQRAPVETITRLVMILTRSCWFGAWVSIFTPQGKFLFKQQPNFCCYLRKILNLDEFWWKKNCCYLTCVFCVNYGHRHLDGGDGRIFSQERSNLQCF